MFVPDDIMTLLNEVMAAILVGAGQEQVDLPERRYITTGGAVYDCEQVVVSANSMALGPAGSTELVSPLSFCDSIWNSSLELSIVRKAAEMSSGPRHQIPPKPYQIEADALTSAKDATILVRAVCSMAGDRVGSIPATVDFGDVAGGLTAVVLGATINVGWS